VPREPRGLRRVGMKNNDLRDGAIILIAGVENLGRGHGP